jgi:prepilin-type N-terminal cleavage/methylation domain-containing protein
MMSRTGNKGFTLLEVMVTTAVLSLGIVFIYQSFFISADAFDYCRNYFKVASWADEKLWEVRDELRLRGPSANFSPSGAFTSGSRVFEWNIDSPLIDPPPLYKINLVLSWKEGKRTAKLLRNTYALYRPEE